MVWFLGVCEYETEVYGENWHSRNHCDDIFPPCQKQLWEVLFVTLIIYEQRNKLLTSGFCLWDIMFWWGFIVESWQIGVYLIIGIIYYFFMGMMIVYACASYGNYLSVFLIWFCSDNLHKYAEWWCVSGMCFLSDRSGWYVFV